VFPNEETVFGFNPPNLTNPGINAASPAQRTGSNNSSNPLFQPPMAMDYYRQPSQPQGIPTQNTVLGIQSKRHFYYTLENEIELDPEIASDLSMIAKS
jgi:hypothetical protein